MLVYEPPTNYVKLSATSAEAITHAKTPEGLRILIVAKQDSSLFFERLLSHHLKCLSMIFPTFLQHIR